LPFRVLFESFGVIFCKVLGKFSLLNLALISYVFGIATIILVLWFFRKIFSPSVALSVALLLVISPLANALSRRALVDVFFAFIVICSFYFYHCYWKSGKIADLSFFSLSVLAGLLAKESMFFIYFCYLSIGAYYSKKSENKGNWGSVILFLGLPVFCFIFICCWLAGGLKPLVEAYVKYFNFQSVNKAAIIFHRGEWFRFIVDYMLLSPLTTLLAIVGLGVSLKDGRNEQGRNICMIYLLSGFFVFTCFLVKNVRYVLFLDVFLRALAVLGIYSLTEKISHPGRARLFLFILFSLVFITDTYQFLNLFVKGKIYDPVTGSLMIENNFLNL